MRLCLNGGFFFQIPIYVLLFLTSVGFQRYSASCNLRNLCLLEADILRSEYCGIMKH